MRHVFYLVYSIGLFVFLFFLLTGFALDDDVIAAFRRTTKRDDERGLAVGVPAVPAKPEEAPDKADAVSKPEVVPTKHDPVPVKSDVVPPKPEAAFVKPDAVSSQHDTLPAKHEVATAKPDTVSSQHDAVPVHLAGIPKTDAVPTKNDAVPVKPEPVPAKPVGGPAKPDAVSSQHDAVPVLADVMPTKHDVVPTKPTGTKTVPTKPAPTIVHQHKLNTKVPEKQKGDIFDSCKLVDHEPWDEELRSFLNTHYDPLAKCNRTFKPLTQLIEGVLDLTFGAALEGGYVCEGRCLEHITDYRYHGTAWETLPMMPHCDVVETRCKKNGTSAYTYNYMHTQVMPIKSNISAKGKQNRAEKKPFKPSVYIVLFDSVADTQSIRSFPKTIDYMQKRFNSTRIRHMNKVGDNSRPNGYAFLLGEIAYSINKDIFGVPNLNGTRTYEQSCNKAMDGNEKSVFARYTKAGYKSMVAEDWARGVFNYPACVGYNHKPVDHYMRPFHLRLEEKVSPQLLKDLMGTQGCREPHMDLMEYMNKFIRAYPDDPKFGFIWMSVLSHDNPNLIFHADDYVQTFFEKNADEFDNSFVFFMGDHGLRFGRQRNSATGRREVNNPMLHVIVPKAIRKSFQPRLEANAHELVTMFDLHATFLDIVDFQPKVNFTGHDFTRIPASTEGSSLLRSLNPSLPRNCRTLPIPFDYCPCEFNTKPVKESLTAWKMANFVVELMNAELGAFNLSECSVLAVDKRAVDVLEFSPVEETNLYKIEFTAKPGKGRFEALLRTHEPTNANSYTLASPFFNRLNAYGHDGDCITRAPQKPFCYCKSNVGKTASREAKKG